MATQRNVYMAANFLIKQHGEDAVVFAAMSADSLAERGDMMGRALWLRVIDAIKEIEARQPTAGHSVH